MNLLAHLHLGATAHPGVAAGNLLADYRRRLPPAAKDDFMEAGVRLHRRIDAQADAHPLHKEARRCISPARRRLAGILVDVFFDYCLTRHWNRFESRPLPDFVDGELDRIARHLRDTQSVYAPFLAKLRNGQWLLSYGTPEGVGQAFERMAARSPAVAKLVGAEGELRENTAALDEMFLSFYPDLVAACAQR
jgi:acyl carrier protein phosphodiesterase